MWIVLGYYPVHGVKMSIIPKFFVDKHQLLYIIGKSVKLFFSHGCRSSKRVDCVHNFLAYHISLHFPKDKFVVLTEKNIPYDNITGKKKCDIVVKYIDSERIHTVFPVKFVMSNYMQNRNNYWENLRGEVVGILDVNPGIRVTPINIIFKTTPYLEKGGTISKFENTNYENSFMQYESLVKRGRCKRLFSAVVDVTHCNVIGDKYDKMPILNDVECFYVRGT